jgi:polyhydroxybutyrate depolymerase
MIDTTPTTSPTPWVTWGQRMLLALGVLGLLWVAAMSWFKAPLPEPALSLHPLPAGCQTGLAGTAGRHTDLRTPGGLKYTVVAPANYNPQRQHGLLIMYPPAGFGSASAERYYQFTTPANQQGFIVVYSDAIPLSTQALRLQSEIATQVVGRWCIDPKRVVYAGHSDGGSIATGLAVRDRDNPVQPTHLLVSAAGIRGEDLHEEACPAPLHVNLLHNPQDERFADYGAGAARWWSACMQCTDAVKEANGCEIKRCAQGRTLRHCETTETHAQWPTVAQQFWRWENQVASTPP